MKILVTGATGFLGKYVIDELLAHDYSIVAFGRNEKIGKALENERVQFVKGDLSSIEELKQAFQSVDAVVHAGALSTAWGPWKAFYQANVVGTKNVLELCREYAVKRLVYVSSPSIYAAGKDQLNIKESDAPKENHLNNYIRSKLASEKLFLTIRMCQVSSCVLEDYLVWGIPAFCLVSYASVEKLEFL